MRIKPLLPALASIAICTGSATALATTSPECDTGTKKCNAKITITACSATGVAKGSAAPNHLHVDKGAWEINWELSGATFTDKGVQFTRNPNRSGGGKVFEGGKKVDDTHFTWKDTNNKKEGPFKYKTQVTFNGKVCTLDPDVSND